MLRKRLGIDSGTAVILFAGKLVPFKRPLDIVGAAAQLKIVRKKIAILVAGAGPLECEMASAAQEAGVAFHALGFCNQSEMPAVYAASDILVLPSDGRETWGLVANEALSCGRPIVLADTVGAAPDLAVDKTVGRIFPVGDVAELANAISDVLQHPPSYEEIAAKSAAYSVVAAAEGICSATAFAVKFRKK
jgi:glycosyltransferase involved in cell wall biosynthesis